MKSLWIILIISSISNVRVQGVFTCSSSRCRYNHYHRCNNKPYHRSTTNTFSNNKRESKSSKLYAQITTIDYDYQQLQQLGFWMASFASSHIGMSAIRQRLIHACGKFASTSNLVGQGFKLPSYWPVGDAYGKNDIFPDEDTAGRQLYRVGYTLVSFVTLGSALVSYLDIHQHPMIQSAASNENVIIALSVTEYTYTHPIAYCVASLSFAAAISSIFNASPLGLMPGFQKKADDNDDNVIIKNDDYNVNFSSSSARKSNTIAGFERDDDIKYDPRGLTRITRHPLILPVVPWGFASALLAGAHTADFVLFGGLAVYAIAGCYCQDLRIIREEGSVGTVFQPGSKIIERKLRCFYETTSFLPFGAVLDGRQSIKDILMEFPFIPFVIGIPIGALLEDTLLKALAIYT